MIHLASHVSNAIAQPCRSNDMEYCSVYCNVAVVLCMLTRQLHTHRLSSKDTWILTLAETHVTHAPHTPLTAHLTYTSHSLNWIKAAQIMLFAIIIACWVAMVVDPVRNNLVFTTEVRNPAPAPSPSSFLPPPNLTFTHSGVPLPDARQRQSLAYPTLGRGTRLENSASPSPHATARLCLTQRATQL